MSAAPTSVKILVVGPKKSGKTTISNFLGQQSKQLKPSPEYEPTAGCRILEFDHESGIPVELWDCSGDQQYGACWPAIQKDADAVILVFNPSEPSDEHDLPLWHEWFVKNIKLDDRQCMVLAHRPSAVGKPASIRSWPPALAAPRTPSRRRWRAAGPLKTATVVESDFTSSPTIAKAFARFLSQVRPFWNDRTSQASGK